MFKVPEKYRVKTGTFKSSQESGNNGFFEIKINNQLTFRVIASDGYGWEHVSISLIKSNALPTWADMCLIKNIFWSKNDTVIQYHPAEKDYINLEENTLHLWRPTRQALPTPPSYLIGPKNDPKKETK